MCPHLCLQALLESFLWYSYASLSMLSVRSFSGKSLPNGSIFLPDKDLNIYHFMYKLQQLQRNLACSLQLFFLLPPNIDMPVLMHYWSQHAKVSMPPPFINSERKPPCMHPQTSKTALTDNIASFPHEVIVRLPE